MQRLGIEEKAALLATADDEDEELFPAPTSAPNDRFPVVAKRPKTYHRHRSANVHPVLCFALILGAFVLGCLSGVIIILYRMSQDSEPTSPSISTAIDLSVRTKLFQSITDTHFLNLTHSIESDDDRAAGQLFDKWQTFSPSLSHIRTFSYDILLAKYAPGEQRNGLDLLDSQDREVLKLDRSPREEFLSLSSLVKSATVTVNSIYYVNYGREEDFAYLFSQRIALNNEQQTVVVMRRNAAILSQTEQIHQAIHYDCQGVIFFDDVEEEPLAMAAERHSFYQEWARHPSEKDRASVLEDRSHDQEHSIAMLILSYDDLQKLLSAFGSDSSQWPSAPPQWFNHRPNPMKIGGVLANFKLRLVANFQEQRVKLPVVMSSIRGELDPDRFVMVGTRLGARQQNRILTEIVQIYTDQVKKGWKPKRSILFCAWSGLEHDQYAVRRWFSENSFLINHNLLAYLDLGNGILSNSTLNLHGSSLLEQIASNAAAIVRSPLQHDHSCHGRQSTPAMKTNDEESHHGHGRRRRRDSGHEHHQMGTTEDNEPKCEEHKLLDEWLRASRNQFGPNQTWNIVQSIDTDSTAALAQLQYGIPSLVIEMTEEKALINETFFAHDYLSSTFDARISAEVYVAYTQFLAEVLRQLVDQPLIAFNLTIYANQIERFTREYIQRFERSYQYLAYHLGDKDDFLKVWNELIQTIRDVQGRIDQRAPNDFHQIQLLNQQLIQFERLFLLDDPPLPGMNSPSKIYKHLLIGPAFGLTGTVVPFPLLSNLLDGIPDDPSGELCDQSRVWTVKLKEQVQAINRTLQGFDGLFP